jgi:predicted RecB family nuclease
MHEILGSHVYAFQGLTKEKAVALEPLGVRTVADLAKWKYATWAEAITLLSKYENADFSSS